MSTTHPLEVFAHCPRCGSERFSADGPRSKRCPDCGFVFYLNAAAAVAAIITDARGRVLLTRRAFEPARGTLDLPGGFAELGESLETAVRREVNEELGVTLGSLRYFCSLPNTYPYGGLTVHTLDAFFVASLPDGEHPVAADDAAEVITLLPDRIDLGQVGFDSVRAALGRWIATAGRPDPTERCHARRGPQII